MNHANQPSKALVEYVIAREAEAAGMTVWRVLSSQSPEPTRVRRQVWKLIMEFSGCSMNGLSTVWGIDRQAIRMGLQVLERAA